MGNYNDLDMSRWKEYPDILTDSLWLIDKRDNSGAHTGDYHGNFVPQVPRQLFSRYTQKGDWILDPFMGSGTALIEAQRMGRNAIGIDLQKTVTIEVENRLASEVNPECRTIILCDNSATADLPTALHSAGKESVQFIIYHPPYWDIIKFSDHPDDLSNTDSLSAFLSGFSSVIDHTLLFLENGRYCAVVIGDKYASGQVIPLGFYCMELFLKKGLLLKAVIIKNYGETKGKANQHAIWRYRALANDFYIFKHEYIFVFKKSKQ